MRPNLAAVAEEAQRVLAIDVTIPAPVGGWNARDARANMPATDAEQLDNFFPDVGSVRLRLGNTQHATSVGSGNVETIAELFHGTTRKMIACSDTEIYDATSVGAATSRKSGFTVGRWQHINFNGTLAMVNGTDAPQDTTDGITFNATSYTGPTAANLIGIFVHQSRTYVWEENSQDFWYSAVNSIGGTYTQFPLSRVGQFGGNLVCAGSWNVEGGGDRWGGGGIGEDIAIFVMSSGQAICYQGDDPSSNWNLIGVFDIGAPLDVRGFSSVAGTPVILTKAGYVDFAEVIRRKRLTEEGKISDKIGKAALEAAKDFASNTGWQSRYFPTQDIFIVNVPVSATEFQQHVMNFKTGAWCRYTDLVARSWGVYNDQPYFGSTDGKVYRAENGQSDPGGDITGVAETAFSQLDAPGVLKTCVAIQPVIAGTGSIVLKVGPQFDFKQGSLPDANYTFTAAQLAWENQATPWELWDEVWEEDELKLATEWLVAAGVGTYIGSRMQVDTQEKFRWDAMTYKIKPGVGII